MKKTYRKRRPFKRTYRKRLTKPMARSMYQIAKKVVNRNVETKTSQETCTDGLQIFHNDLVQVTGNLLATVQGTDDSEVGRGDRIGDRISLRGVKLSFMLELNERYSDVTFRILVIKSARNDYPSRATLFHGESGNKMMDTIKKERYSIIAQKFVKIRAPNQGVNPSGEVGVGSGIYYQEPSTNGIQPIITRATRIVKMWIPGFKFAKGGQLQYEDASINTKFFDYTVQVYAYSNYSTLQDVYYVGRVNEFLSKMYYKDA